MIKKLILILTILLVFCNSCLHAAVIFQDDFDGYTGDPRTVIGWGYNDILSGNYVELTETEGYGGSRGLKVTYYGPDNNDAYIGIPADFTTRGDVYVRFYAKREGTIPSGSSSKFLKFFGINTVGWANTTFTISTENDHKLGLVFGEGEGIQNDAQAAVWLDGYTQSGVTINTATTNFTPDSTWRCYEVYLKYNTDDNRDGEYKVWIDGVLRLHATNVKNRNNANVRGIMGIELGGYAHTSSTSWNLWYDNVVVSDQYIGSLGTPPDEPVDGVCGTADGGSFSEAPTTNLCSAGTASDVSCVGSPCTWTCDGSNGGSSDSCSATLLLSAITLLTSGESNVVITDPATGNAIGPPQ